MKTFAVQFRVESPGRVGEVGGVVRAENLKSMTYTQKQLEYIASVDGEAHISAVEIIGEAEGEAGQLREKLEEARTLMNELARAIEHNGPGAAAFQILKVNAFLERFKEETT